jgi:hypothetical protein
MRKLLALFVVVAACVGLIASPASAATTLVYYETVAPEDVQFIPACVPGPENPACDPRGPGSVLISTGTLSATQGGPAVGSVYTKCTTTRKVGADYYGFCLVVLTTPQGKFIAVGEINETGLERYEPQRLTLVGARGTLTVQQIVYPNVFRLTVTLR